MGGLGRLLFSQPMTKEKAGRFAMADQDYGKYSDIFIFIPEKRQVMFTGMTEGAEHSG